MKLFFLPFFLFCRLIDVFGQTQFPQSTIASHSTEKPPIDSIAIGNWPSIGERPAISNDGTYFMYTVHNQPVGRATLAIQSFRKPWKREFLLENRYRYAFSAPGFFSADSKLAVYYDMDTLRIVTLGAKNTVYAVAINSYKQEPRDKGEWLAYQPKNQANILILRNLLTGAEHRLDSIREYSFSDNGNVLLLQTQINRTKELVWLNLQNGQRFTIWSSTEAIVSAYGLDEKDTQIAFIVRTPKDSQLVNSVWYYRTGMDKAIRKVDEHALDSGLSISNAPPSFNATGDHILFKLNKSLLQEKCAPDPDAVMVDIWSYKDKVLRFPEVAVNAANYLPQTEYTAVVSTQDSRVIRLEQEDECITAVPGRHGNFVIIAKMGNVGDQYWRNEPVTYYLRSLQDGSSKIITTGTRMGLVGPNIRYPSFSPHGDYLVYYDLLQQHYFSYNIATGQLENISKAIPTKITVFENDNRKNLLSGSIYRSLLSVGMAGWFENAGILLYDNYDIWQVDMSGKNPPINITRGYGLKNNIRFRIAFEKESLDNDKYKTYSKNDILLLTAFNKGNKYSGFYRTSITSRQDPEELAMGPWQFQLPLKAANVDEWIVKRESPTQAPNYFHTNDLRYYEPLTDLQPQQAFNWLQAELIHFKCLDGNPSQGILYKPEDFDPNKIYPLIINYYEAQADELFDYKLPGYTDGDLNVPWFVSRGYLVFKPDIYYEVGEIGSSAYNSIVGGAIHLSNMPWINRTRMGLQGHSFGGYQTIYLISHCNMFAAAVEGAGPSDLVSVYGGLQLGSRTGAEAAETSQFRMASTLWERPDLYIKNSPVFKTDQVTTPLLMMHNRNDPVVSWYQGLEFFTGLRRLNKKVWMLQYDNGGHGVFGKDATDYTIRTTQFFDHYLKGILPPRWMTEGVAPELKGKTTGFELDQSGSQP